MLITIDWFQGSGEVVQISYSVRRHILFVLVHLYSQRLTKKKTVLFSSSGCQLEALDFLKMYECVVLQHELALYLFSAPYVYSNQSFWKSYNMCLMKKTLSVMLRLHTFSHASWQATKQLMFLQRSVRHHGGLPLTFETFDRPVGNRCWAAPTQVAFPCTTWSLVRPLSSVNKEKSF